MRPRHNLAIWTLTAGGKEAVSFLQKQVKPASAADQERIAKLLTALDGDKFTVREEATQELAKLGAAAEPALRQTLRNPPSTEVHRRVEQLLEKLKEKRPPPAWLRPLRAVEALEHIGTAEAKQVLEELSKGAAAAELTREAHAALGRLAKRPRP